MKTLLATLTLLTATLGSQAAVSLVTGPILNPDNGHTYYMSSVSSWTEAEAFAVSMGGHLATIRNAQEDAWVYSTFITLPNVDTLWLGLNDAQQEGTFVWASGETSTYRNWAPGEPNNIGGIEDYARYFQTYSIYPTLWNDAPDNAFCNGIIELVPEPSALALFGLGAALVVWRRK